MGEALGEVEELMKSVDNLIQSDEFKSSTDSPEDSFWCGFHLSRYIQAALLYMHTLSWLYFTRKEELRTSLKMVLCVRKICNLCFNNN